MSDWKTLSDMLGLKIRPIDAWPGKLLASWERERGPYSAPLKDTLGMLKTELNFLGAEDIVLQAAFRERDLRLDGLPRAGVNTEHPGIILCFNVRGAGKERRGHRRAFDRFSRWEHNLRALAMNLYHLRMANLYGVEGDEQQYTGWKALPPGPDETKVVTGRSFITEKDAALFLLTAGGLECDEQNIRDLLVNADVARKAIRAAQQKHHPDVGGSADMFRRVMEAAEIVKKRHNL